MKLRLLALAFATLFPAGAYAQITAVLPVTCNPNSPGDCIRSQPTTRPDGLNIGANANLATVQISVGTTATLVAAARAGRSRIMVTQSAAGPCYYGSSAAVSATTGARLTVAGASKTYQYAGALYGICPDGAVTVDVDEEY